MRWGDRHLAGPDGPPLVLEHHCGERLVPQLVCQACGEPLEARDTKPANSKPKD
jgi:hypothetical protein